METDWPKSPPVEGRQSPATGTWFGEQGGSHILPRPQAGTREPAGGWQASDTGKAWYRGRERRKEALEEARGRACMCIYFGLGGLCPLVPNRLLLHWIITP